MKIKINPNIIGKMEKAHLDINEGQVVLLSVYFNIDQVIDPSFILKLIKAGVLKKDIAAGELKVIGDLFGQPKQFSDASLKEWLKKWPTHVMPGGYRVSANSKACTSNMKKFVRDFEYSLETIEKATDLYLKEQGEKGWHYTKKNAKFINDSTSSTLEDYCERVVNGVSEEEGDDWFKEVV